MKKLLTILFLFCFYHSFAQINWNPLQTLGSPTSLVYAKGALGTDSALIFKVNFADTTAANRSIYVKTTPQTIIIANDTMWKRNAAGTAWVKIGAGSAGQTLQIGTINSQTKAANGAVINGNDLVLQTINTWTGNPGLLINSDRNKFGVKRPASYFDSYNYEASPYLTPLLWSLQSSTVYPDDWRDGPWALSLNDTLFTGNGWRDYGAGAPATTDSIRYSVDLGATWAFYGLMPFKGHSITVVNAPDGYIYFMGNDGFGTATQRKSVYRTNNLRDFTLMTNNWELGDRVLTYGFADDVGNLYAGGGQTDAADSSTAVSDMWISTDQGATWTRIQNNVIISGHEFLGGNVNGQVIFADGRVNVIGGGLQDNSPTDRTYSAKCYSISINDITNQSAWRRDTDMPYGAQYKCTILFNGSIWAFTGNTADNLKTVTFRDKVGVWHTYNSFVGTNPGDLSFTITHAAAVCVHKGNIFRILGNGQNSCYRLRRFGVWFPEGNMQMVFKTGSGFAIGVSNFPAWSAINLPDTGNITANTFFDFRAMGTLTYGRIESSDPFPIQIMPASGTTNNVTGVLLNGTGGPVVGQSSVGSGLANGVGFFLSNNFQLWIRSDGSTRLANAASTVPVKTATLEVPGITRSAIGGSKKRLIYDTATGTGGFFYTDDITVPTVFDSIPYINGVGSSTEGNIGIDTAASLNRLAFKAGGWWYHVAVTDSTSIFDADALAFFAACVSAGTTLTLSQKEAINNLILGLKANSLWTTMGEAWPVIGGTAGTHALGLKLAFPLTFNGSWTHNSSGADPGGTSADYAQTGFDISTVVGNNNISIGFYSGENLTSGTYVMGVFNTSGSKEASLIPYGSNQTTTRLGTNSVQAASAPAQNTYAFFIGARVNSTTLKQYRNGVQIGSTVSTSDSQVPTNEMYLAAGNINGTANFAAANRMIFCFIYKAGLTDGQVTTLNTLVEAYEDALGRGNQ